MAGWMSRILLAMGIITGDIETNILENKQRVLAISGSGETGATLADVARAKKAGLEISAIVSQQSSPLAGQASGTTWMMPVRDKKGQPPVDSSLEVSVLGLLSVGVVKALEIQLLRDDLERIKGELSCYLKKLYQAVNLKKFKRYVVCLDASKRAVSDAENIAQRFADCYRTLAPPEDVQVLLDQVIRSKNEIETQTRSGKFIWGYRISWVSNWLRICTEELKYVGPLVLLSSGPLALLPAVLGFTVVFDVAFLLKHRNNGWTPRQWVIALFVTFLKTAVFFFIGACAPGCLIAAWFTVPPSVLPTLALLGFGWSVWIHEFNNWLARSYPVLRFLTYFLLMSILFASEIYLTGRVPDLVLNLFILLYVLIFIPLRRSKL